MDSIVEIARALDSVGGRAVVVGGCVRDRLLGLPVKDFDVEVFGISDVEQLKSILSQFGVVNEVGKFFSVLKLGDFDFALARTETKTGAGHRGFDVVSRPELSFQEAASRRDFTINAIGLDPLTDEILDPFHGREDLKKKIIRHVGPAFSEDPLRVLRAMQFAGRFEFDIDPETVALCRSIDLTELPKERIWEEFKKLLLKSRCPSMGLKWAKELGILKLFPELSALIDVPQDPEWHPEGDVWVHTLMVVDEMAALSNNIVLLLAAICHDFGKPSTTKFSDGHWRSLGHEEAGVEPTKSFLKRLLDDKDIVQAVAPLVAHHLKPAMLYKANLKQTVSDSAIRRLAMKVPIGDLLLLARADHFGRTTPDALAREHPAGDWLMQRASHLAVHDQKPHPILQGRHLMELGFAAGPRLGKIAKEAFELQLDGKIQTLEQALEWVRRAYPNP